MIITKAARAGTLESSDIFIMIMPNTEDGIEIQLESLVIKQFGEQIRRVIMDTLQRMEIKKVKVIANDRGALDYAIRSRVETAVQRALSNEEES
ncbi:MAG: citrate lyase acyl carrier protein [Tissierellales bacterium]|nr:citrate lyase acyl carrier protein [Tissierellales bacterium]